MEDKGRELTRNTFIYAIGNLGSRILGFLMVPVYSFYLNKNEFGYFDLVITTISLFVPLLTMQLSDSIFRWLLEVDNNAEANGESEWKKSAIITNAFTVVLFNIVVSVFVLVILEHFFKIGINLTLFLLLATSTLYPLVQLSVRGLRMNRLFALNGVIYSAITLVANIILLILFHLSVQALFISAIIANIVCGIYMAYKARIFSYINFRTLSGSLVKELLKYGGPLIPNTISWWLVNSANKYIILNYLGIEANGVYAVANRFPAIMVMIDSILIMAWQESAILHYHKEDRNEFFSNVFKKMMYTQLSAALLLVITSPFIIELLISDSFLESWKYMPILYLGVAFSTFSAFYGTIYLSVKRTNIALITSMCSALVNLALCFFLVNKIGLYGVALSTLCGYIFLYAIRVFQTRRYIAINIDKGPLLIFALLFSCSFVALYVVKIRLLLFVLLVISLAFVIILNKQSIIFIFRQLKSRIRPMR
jgi:O-antigen/teichoic acid export membrane protein